MITKAYLQGWDTFENGSHSTDNPYDEFAQSMEYCDWEQGFKDAREALDG